jgi:thioredoxin-related protein
MWRENLNLQPVLVFFTALVILISPAAFAREEAPLDAGMVNPGYVEKPDWFKVSFLDLYEDVAEAAANQRRVMLYFYQDGCPYCKKLLQDNFGQRAIAEKTRKYFDVVPINIWGDRDVTIGDKTVSEKQFAEVLKVQYTPTLIFFDEKNKIVYRANGYYPPEKFVSVLDYVGQKKETEASYLDYAKNHPLKQKSSGKLHTGVATVKDPRNLKAALEPDRHLLVMFEQPACAACDELHLDILKREASLAQLRRLDVVVLDMWSNENIVTPDGRKLKIYDWAKQLNIEYAPSLVYFDAFGKEVFRSDAYLKAFHLQSGMDYVASSAYLEQPNFQRYIEDRAARLREQGVVIDLMK